GCPPVVLVAVEDHRRLRRDAEAARELRELLRIEVVARERVVQVGVAGDGQCTGDVPGVVEEKVLNALQDPEPLVVQVLRDPLRGDECLRVRIATALEALRVGSRLSGHSISSGSGGTRCYGRKKARSASLDRVVATAVSASRFVIVTGA